MYLLKGIQKSFDFQNNQEKKKIKKMWLQMIYSLMGRWH